MTQSTPPPPCDLDQEYYWDFVTFSTSDEKKFRVPKYRFVNDSEAFATEYKLDQENGSENGYTLIDATPNPMKLDVDADRFRAFLKVLYPKEGHDPKLELLKDEWISVLRLSSDPKWLFSGIRKNAIEHLTSTKLDPIEQVTFGKEFGVEEWLLSGYCELIKRTGVITVDEARQIGCELAIELYIIRDKRTQKFFTQEDALDTEIRAAFGVDFAAIQVTNYQYLTAKEKEEAAKERAEEEERAKELADEDAEHLRLQSVAAEEQKKIAELVLELEERRRKLEYMVVVDETPDEPVKVRKPVKGKKRGYTDSGWN